MKRTPLLLLIGLVVAALVAWGMSRRGVEGTGEFRTVKIERGDVVSSVSSSGTIRAITTVQVGTQVSGQIAETLVDFNDRVKRGQLIARIDPTLLQQEVRSAETAVERAGAELDQARIEADRARKLFADDLTSESERDLKVSALAISEAQTKSAQIGLDRARRNLGYSDIRSPIDGVILERNVDVGQTVAASLSAPQLFLIAEDLAKLQILASVDESDIGQIHEGQETSFTVTAYPNETFAGRVDQVRLQSAMAENVVSYTVVVAVDNTDGRLLPGMTTTVEFILNRAKDALKVSNVALRFRPTEEMRAALGENGAKGANEGNGERRRGARADSSRNGGEARPDSAGGQGAVAAKSSARPTFLWAFDEKGKPAPIRVKTGITDGQFTVVEGEGLTEGLEVIASVTGASTTAATNPFQSTQRTAGRPGPPPGM